MLRFNLKIVFRNLLKNKVFSFINIFGFSIGLACSLFILIYVYFELSFDRFHKNFKDIYQVQQRIEFTGGEYTSDRVGGAFAQALKDGFPEIKEATRIGQVPEVLISFIPDAKTDPKDKRINFIEKKGIAVDSSFLKIFTFTLVKGNPVNALTDIHSIVLSEEMAGKYFPEGDPLGKTLLINDNIQVQVTGILAKVPVKSNIQFDFILPINLMKDISFLHDSMGGTVYYTYLLLNKVVDYQYLNTKIPPYIEKLEEGQAQLKRTPFLLPFRKVHLFDEKRSYIGVYTMGTIAFLILITACINFINLSTARSFDRAKEVGIKKTEGATRGQLIIQFLTETLLITIISFFISLILIEIALPAFNRAFGSNITTNLIDWKFLIGLAGIIFITSILSGTYPAFMLSSFNPVQALYKKKSGKEGKKLRKVLVVLQFSISIFTILATSMLVSQLKHMKTADLGFNKEDIIIIPARGSSSKEYDVIRNELTAFPEILNVTTASDIPDNINYGEIEWGSTQEMVHENQAIARIMRVGYDFDKTFGLKMEKGRFFSRDHSTDANKGVIINSETANILGYDDPVDKPFYLFGDEYTIIGMVEDFQFFPLNLGGKAMFMVFSDEQPLIFLKYRPGNAKEAINYTQQVFQEYNSNYPFEYFFYDDYDRVINKIGYASSILLIYFSFFGIFISCLGLLGLAIYSAEIKTKEFGIRKAFGATVKQIVFVQSKEFAWLIFIAHLIAVPLAYFLLNQVLKLFAYKIDLSVWYFIITMIGIYTLSFLTTGWQACSAARKNPVDALRYE